MYDLVMHSKLPGFVSDTMKKLQRFKVTLETKDKLNKKKNNK